jgi:N utilization substance protein B
MSARQSRSVARLAAVQALYQMEVSSIGVEHVIREFTEHRFDRDADGIDLAAADEGFFAELVRGVVAEQMRAILRAGAFELVNRPDVPTEVAIDEYVDVAKSFFEGSEPGFVNGALDGVARDVRPA